MSFEKVVCELKGKDLEGLLDVIGMWAASLGVQKDITKIDIKMISTFILNQFGGISLNEIQYAIQLSLAQKLNCDSQLYGKGLNVSYVGNILNAYMIYKRASLSDVNYKLQNEYKEKEVTSKQKMDIALETLTICYREWKENNKMDNLDSLYNLFRRIKLIPINKELQEQALAYGKAQAKKFYAKHYNYSLKDRIEISKGGIDAAQKRYARNYVISEFFKKNELNSIIEKINIQQFQ
jgi:hypothetical protein